MAISIGLGFSTAVVFAFYWTLLMQARRGLACMCLPEHPQQQFCRADFGKLLTKLFLRKLLNL